MEDVSRHAGVNMRFQVQLVNFIHPHQRTCSRPLSSTPAYLLTSSIIHVSVPAHILHHPRQHTCLRPSSSTSVYLLTSSIIHVSVPAHILHHPHQRTCSRPPSSTPAYLLTSSIIHVSIPAHTHSPFPHPFTLSPPAPPIYSASPHLLLPIHSASPLSLSDPSILSGSTDPFILTPSPIHSTPSPHSPNHV
jgi:hypothetical protein